MLGHFEVGDCYEYVGLSWVRKAAVWIQFNLQTRLQAFLEVLGISRGQIWNRLWQAHNSRQVQLKRATKQNMLDKRLNSFKPCHERKLVPVASYGDLHPYKEYAASTFTQYKIQCDFTKECSVKTNAYTWGLIDDPHRGTPAVVR